MMKQVLARVVACGLLLAGVSGCGDDRPERVPVKGVVLIDGEPLTHGFVMIVPDNARPSQSPLDSEGRFELSTFGDKDGAIPGTHKVAVVGLENVSANVQRWHAPKKYMEAETSGLTVTIPDNAEKTEPITINLSWEGGKTFDEKLEAE
ncbi:MAG: hypothetical protein R3C01_05360 [Planctomycetaceae bacterium]